MKKKFSKHWKASKQPRKQRKYRYNASLHIRRKMTSVNLSKELRKKYGKRNFPVVKGDSVRIARGKFKGKTGKIMEVNLKKLKVTIDGIYRTKKDGTKIAVKFDPSKLQIKELNLDDKKRKEALERKIINANQDKSNLKASKEQITKDQKLSIESFEKPQIQNSQKRTLIQFPSEIRSYSKSSINKNKSDK